MWEPGSNSSNSSKTASNRDIILLVSALSFCFLLYQIWGPLLLITCALIFVVHTCYSLYFHDSLFAPHTVVLLKYTGKFTLQLAQTTRILTSLGFQRSKKGLIFLRNKYEEKKRKFFEVEEEDMGTRQRNVYRLSTSGTENTEQTTPMNNDSYHLFGLNGSSNNPRCSTPIPRGGLGGMWKKETPQNGGFGLLKHPGSSPIKKSTLIRNENRPPAYMLPASFRYNIDPKIYKDVSSPGITSRITKYAAEANCKLTHQPQYGPGQFPKVNLNALPAPIISPKTIRARMPVTVRVAPPDVINYNMHDSHSFQERHKLFSNTSGSEIKESKSCPSVNQVLKEISLKRHASREDIMLDLVKKQRSERISEGQLENLEEMMQKRARDESSNSEEDLSPKKSQRPTKRSKSSSCHDILNSLSSSVNVYSGVKRKAIDCLQSDSPDNEKHFKPSSKSPDCSITSISPSREFFKSKEQLNVKVPVVKVPKELPNKSPEKIFVNVEINQKTPEKKQTHTPKVLDQSTPNSKGTAITKTTKLEDKLFMKAEPQPNRKLKILVEEQTNMEAKFQTDDEEITKQDIDNMKQNSMRLRLQSMYDAISGKSSSKIDPDVVIQAEEVNPPASANNFITLNSLTSTTTVNTSPITTTIVPILKSDNDNKSTTPKHVTFNIPSSSSTFTNSSTTLPVPTQNTEKQTELKSVEKLSSMPKAFDSKSSPSPTFSFGNNTSTVTASTTTTASTTSSGFSFMSNSNSATLENKTSVTSSAIVNNSVSSTLFTSKPVSENSTTTSTNVNSGFSFNSNAKISSNSTSSMTALPTQSSGTSTPSSLSGFATINTPKTSSNTSTTIPTVTNFNVASDKKENFTFGAPASTSNNATDTTIPNANSLFSGPPKSNIAFSSNVVSTVTSAPVTSSALPIFSFGANTNKTSEQTNRGFSFNVATTASTIAFGGSAPTTTGSGFGTSSSTGPTSIAPSATFGNPTQSLFNASSSAPSLFSGSSNSSTMFKSPNTTAVASGTTPLFGATTNTTTGFGSTTNASTGFGSTTSAPKGFGSTTSAATGFGSSTSASTGFGSTSNNANTGFGSTTSTLTGFGSTSSAATTAASGLFGNNTNNSTIPSLFQNAANSPVATTTSLTGFGSSTQQQHPQGSIFGAAPATTASIFGSSAAASSSSGLFSGSMNSASAANTTNMGSLPNSTDNRNMFGQTKSPTMNFGASNSSFGTSNSTFSAPNTNSSTFQIGSTSTSSGLTTFGGIKPTSPFGGSTNDSQAITTTTSSIFGSTANTGFGGNASTGGFGSSNTAGGSTFGTTAPGASAFGSSTFGSSTIPSASSPFGSSATPAATSPFGAQTTTSTSTSNIFGNSATNSGSSAFTFGGNNASQPQQPAQQQTQAPFNFSGSTSNSANSGGVFQFGGATSAPAKPAGFNFSAPTGAPTINFTGGSATHQAFSAPNMFSIGSGSTTPRSRTGRPRRQR